jgi:hypothetical protein
MCMKFLADTFINYGNGIFLVTVIICNLCFILIKITSTLLLLSRRNLRSWSSLVSLRMLSLHAYCDNFSQGENVTQYRDSNTRISIFLNCVVLLLFYVV